MISPKQCIKCKGKLLCGLSYCPILEKHSVHKRITSQIKGKNFSSNSPPGLFVSWHSFPKVLVAPLSSPLLEGNTEMLDLPEKWFGLPAKRIIEFRESLLRSTKKISASEASNPGTELQSIQELTLSSTPLQVEISLLKKPSLEMSFNNTIAPLGPKAPLKKLSLSENPKIPKKVDYLVSDIDVKASTAVLELFNAGFPVSFLYKILSAGTLGVQKARRIVPTRWAITAIDSTVSKALIEEKIKFFKQIGEIQLFHSNYLDNSFYVLLYPSEWSFEQLECYLPGSSWALQAKEHHIIQDHEFYGGRKNYASNVEGAYYAARLAVAEHLLEKKRQASAIVFREIGPGYNIPLGVWQVRENVRNALKQKPLVFFDFGEQYEKESKLIDKLKHQKKLSDF